MSEYFVKFDTESDASGPYTIESLRDLVESGKLTRECYVFDEEVDGFIPLSENDALWQQIQPVKKVGLKLKKKEPEVVETQSSPKPQKKPSKAKTETETNNATKGLDESVDLNRVLAAAEGNTKETGHVKRPKLTQLRAARVIIPGIMISILVFLSAVIGAYYDPLYNMISESNYEIGLFLQNWILIFALIDLVIMLAVGLGQTNIFPFLRLRACIGIGFFCFIYYSTQNWEAMGAVTAYQFGLFASTLTYRFLPTLFYLVLSAAGAGFFSYLFWSGKLVI